MEFKIMLFFFFFCFVLFNGVFTRNSVSLPQILEDRKKEFVRYSKKFSNTLKEFFRDTNQYVYTKSCYLYVKACSSIETCRETVHHNLVLEIYFCSLFFLKLFLRNNPSFQDLMKKACETWYEKKQPFSPFPTVFSIC